MPTLDLPDFAMPFEVHGERGGPVLLLGGTGMPGFVWQMSQVPALLAAGFRCVTFDTRGVAAGSPPGPYTVAQLADDAVALIAHLDVAPVHLVGVSQGGFAAERLAHVRPDLVDTVTLIASAGATTAYTRAWAQGWQDLLASGLPIPQSLFVSDNLVHGLPLSVLQGDDAVVEKWLDMLVQAQWTSPGMRGQYAACYQWLLTDDHDSRRSVMDMPCLVLAFEHDVHFPPRSGEQAAARMPRGEFRAVGGVGHVDGLFEAADPINAALVDFLGRHAGTGPRT